MTGQHNLANPASQSHIAQIRLLPTSFGVAPAYAHLARLSGTRKPEGRDKYQKEATRTFRDLVFKTQNLAILCLTRLLG